MKREGESGEEKFWKKEAAAAKSRLQNPPGAEYYEKGFQKMPAHRLNYFGNGFYKINVQGQKPRLIRSDQDMMDVASIMRWRAMTHSHISSCNARVYFHADHSRGFCQL